MTHAECLHSFVVSLRLHFFIVVILGRLWAFQLCIKNGNKGNGKKLKLTRTFMADYEISTVDRA